MKTIFTTISKGPFPPPSVRVRPSFSCLESSASCVYQYYAVLAISNTMMSSERVTWTQRVRAPLSPVDIRMAPIKGSDGS